MRCRMLFLASNHELFCAFCLNMTHGQPRQLYVPYWFEKSIRELIERLGGWSKATVILLGPPTPPPAPPSMPAQQIADQHALLRILGGDREL